jgi:hypothetical protein
LADSVADSADLEGEEPLLLHHCQYQQLPVQVVKEIHALQIVISLIAIAPTSSPDANTSGNETSTRSSTPSDCISMDAVFNLCQDTSRLVRTVDTRLRSVEDKTQKLSSTLKELNDYMKKYCKSSFKVKGSQYEVRCDRLQLIRSNQHAYPHRAQLRQKWQSYLSTLSEESQMIQK